LPNTGLMDPVATADALLGALIAEDATVKAPNDEDASITPEVLRSWRRLTNVIHASLQCWKDG
jgi:hypothetical protein